MHKLEIHTLGEDLENLMFLTDHHAENISYSRIRRGCKSKPGEKSSQTGALPV